MRAAADRTPSTTGSAAAPPYAARRAAAVDAMTSAVRVASDAWRDRRPPVWPSAAHRRLAAGGPLPPLPFDVPAAYPPCPAPSAGGVVRATALGAAIGCAFAILEDVVSLWELDARQPRSPSWPELMQFWPRDLRAVRLPAVPPPRAWVAAGLGYAAIMRLGPMRPPLGRMPSTHGALNPAPADARGAAASAAAQAARTRCAVVVALCCAFLAG